MSSSREAEEEPDDTGGEACPHTIAGVIMSVCAAWVVAIAPKAFMGWTGIGVRYTKPQTSIESPNLNRMPNGSILRTPI